MTIGPEEFEKGLEDTVTLARQEAAADMRERAAKEADMCGEHHIADRIRALPLEEKDGE